MSILAIIRYMIGRVDDNPVYTRDKSGWAYLGLWASLRRSCLPIVALLLLGTAGICGILPLLSGDLENIVFSGYAILFGFYIVGEILHLLATLLATALSGTSVSAEIESRTLDTLRLTLLEPHDMALAKFGSIMRELRSLVYLTVGTRLLAVFGTLLYSLAIGVIALLVADMITPDAPPTSPPPIDPASLGLTALEWLTIGLTILIAPIALVLWLLYFFVQPVLRVGLFAALGIFASSLSRSRSGGLVTSVLLRGAFWVIRYILGQVLSLGGTIALTILPLGITQALGTSVEAFFATTSGLLIAGAAMIGAIVALIYYLGLMWLLVGGASRRIRRLSPAT